MKIAVHGRKFGPESAACIQELFEELHKRKCELFISDIFSNILTGSSVKIGKVAIYDSKEMVPADFVISVGGDGTLLETVSHIGPMELPILGINTGRLGFLATISKERISESIETLYQNTFSIEDRTLVKLHTDRPLFDGKNFGLNDFTILKKDTSSMITVHTYIDGEYLNSYWADGLIVATPTGSTGYSLSCGGPVVLPHSNNFIITPVSPHNLTVRPMIVSDKSVISFEIEGRGQNFLVSLDSRSQTVDATIQMAISKEDFSAKLVKLNDSNFLDTLRQKLNWGYDARN